MNFCVIYTPDYRHRHHPISTSISPTVRLHPAHAKHHSVQGGMMSPPNALSACHFDRMSLILCSRHSVAVKSRRLPLVLTCAQSAKRLSAHPLFHDISMISKWNHEFHGIWDGPLHISLVSRACEALGWGAVRKTVDYVSDRTSFFSNSLCLSNFRESARTSGRARISHLLAPHIYRAVTTQNSNLYSST